jgi:hypothetical protein
MKARKAYFRKKIENDNHDNIFTNSIIAESIFVKTELCIRTLSIHWKTLFSCVIPVHTGTEDLRSESIPFLA